MQESKEIYSPPPQLFTPLKGLNWKDRPSELQERINKCAQDLSKKDASTWMANGRDEYGIFNISQVDFMKKTILRNYPDRKDFYFLDLGAGKFRSIRYLSMQINKDKTLPRDITVHCIGVRGETNQEGEIIKEGICIRYELGAFAIENLMTEFAKRGLVLDGLIDMLVSSWTFRHLIDPIGTFMQAHSLLRLNSGIILCDGWYFLVKDLNKETDWISYSAQSMEWFCVQLGEPVFFDDGNGLSNGLINFALKRTKFQLLSIPLKYNTIHEHSFVPNKASNAVVVFDLIPELSKSPESFFKADVCFKTKKYVEKANLTARQYDSFRDFITDQYAGLLENFIIDHYGSEEELQVKGYENIEDVLFKEGFKFEDLVPKNRKYINWKELVTTGRDSIEELIASGVKREDILLMDSFSINNLITNAPSLIQSLLNPNTLLIDACFEKDFELPFKEKPDAVNECGEDLSPT